jgi:hypothetical protein
VLPDFSWHSKKVQKYTNRPQNVPNGPKTNPLALQYTKWQQNKTNIFHSKAFQNIYKLGFFGMQLYHLATMTNTSLFL